MEETNGHQTPINNDAKPRKSFRRRVIHLANKHWWVVYALPFVLFLFFICFGSNNVFKLFSYSSRISKLNRQIEAAEQKLKRDSIYMEARAQSSELELEQTARTQYLMKRPNELVFKLIDTTANKKNNNE